ncbi:MAG TPA: glycosyltransferase family 2 protein [Candidatus Gastranaerophilales bacterium]|nr:glycosyltransferase family 2 protein [Candidatus Gastranaerophilales bacterium]
MDVSIILVSYNTKNLTKECIKSIYEKTNGLSYEIWVVDNASSDGSVEMLQQEFPEVKLIASKENLGFGKANNVAIKQSYAKYCLLLNTDTVLLNNAVKIFFDFMENPENINVGACGGQLYNADMSNQLSFGEFNDIEKLKRKALGIDQNVIRHRINRFFEKKVKGNQNYIYDARGRIGEVDYIIGADLMLRKSALDKAGIFDEIFFMYGEESELQFRIKKHGYNIKIIPDAKILHYGGASSANKNKQLDVEKMLLKGNINFFKLCYGQDAAKKAKFYYIIYYLRYFALRFFAPKAFSRLKTALELEI